MGKFGNHLSLLIWKNWLIKKRRYELTALELGLPIFSAFLLVLIRLMTPAIEKAKPDVYEFQRLQQLPSQPLKSSSVVIGYAPGCRETEKIMDFVKEKLERRAGKPHH